MNGDMTRRAFIRKVAGGGGFALGAFLVACTTDDPTPTTTRGGPAPSTSSGVTTVAPPTAPTTTSVIAGDPAAFFEPHLLLQIAGTGAVTVTVPKSEMGQAVRTALAMVVAEELDADWSDVTVETAPGDRAYGDQVTGGSLSVSTRFEPLRRIGGLARLMLITAAAAEWGVDPSECTTEPGAVVERDGERRAGYGALAELAAQVDLPLTVQVPLKDPADFRIVGTPTPAVDAVDFVTGRAVYGSDAHVPGMVHAAVARPPTFGGRLRSYDDAAARTTPGVIDVVEISTGIAVLADTTWAALEGREALAITWEPGDRVDDASIRRMLEEKLDGVTPGPGEMTAEYVVPYFAHLAMETLTCLADADSEHCEVWAATQHPQLARGAAARGTQLLTDQVTVTVPFIGGAFGRRLDQDFVEEAAELAATIGGPVKLFRSRSDDILYDRFHPASVTRAIGDPARPAAVRLDTALAWDRPVPTGNWRSVTNAPDAFARESFLDELAHAAGADPYEYRRPLLDDRARAVLDRVATEAGWGRPVTSGRGRGIAQHETWGVSPTAMVAEVTVSGTEIRLDRMVCAIDCGIVINPDRVTAQLEGAVAFATTAALLGGVTVAGGSVTASNFDDAPILRFDQMPEVEVHIIESGAPPTGVGEAGVPPVAPAIANAVFAATGRRLRALPLRMG